MRVLPVSRVSRLVHSPVKGTNNYPSRTSPQRAAVSLGCPEAAASSRASHQSDRQQLQLSSRVQTQQQRSKKPLQGLESLELLLGARHLVVRGPSSCLSARLLAGLGICSIIDEYSALADV